MHIKRLIFIIICCGLISPTSILQAGNIFCKRNLDADELNTKVELFHNAVILSGNIQGEIKKASKILNLPNETNDVLYESCKNAILASEFVIHCFKKDRKYSAQRFINVMDPKKNRVTRKALKGCPEMVSPYSIFEELHKVLFSEQIITIKHVDEFIIKLFDNVHVLNEVNIKWSIFDIAHQIFHGKTVRHDSESGSQDIAMFQHEPSLKETHIRMAEVERLNQILCYRYELLKQLFEQEIEKNKKDLKLKVIEEFITLKQAEIERNKIEERLKQEAAKKEKEEREKKEQLKKQNKQNKKILKHIRRAQRIVENQEEENRIAQEKTQKDAEIQVKKEERAQEINNEKEQENRADIFYKKKLQQNAFHAIKKYAMEQKSLYDQAVALNNTRLKSKVMQTWKNKLAGQLDFKKQLAQELEKEKRRKEKLDFEQAVAKKMKNEKRNKEIARICMKVHKNQKQSDHYLNPLINADFAQYQQRSDYLGWLNKHLDQELFSSTYNYLWTKDNIPSSRPRIQINCTACAPYINADTIKSGCNKLFWNDLNESPEFQTLLLKSKEDFFNSFQNSMKVNNQIAH